MAIHFAHRISATKLATAVAVVGAAYAQPFRPLVVVGSSMQPTYREGEVLLTVPVEGAIKENDVVIVRRPEGTFIKRVALVEGDKYLQVRVGQEWIDAIFQRPGNRDTAHVLRYAAIPKGYVYVLGDNLKNSIDSRTFGPVPISQIQAKVYQGRSSPRSTWRADPADVAKVGT